MILSENQRAAVLLDGDIIVSAGAGSGKTTVMVERIVRMLVGGADLEQMLIVTFTRAAAADIKIKLARRLSKLRAEAEARLSSCGQGERDECARLRDVAIRASEMLPVCNIGTLHSFCQRLIRAYTGASEIDPASVVMDDGDTVALKRSALRTAVDGAWREKNPYFMAMYEALSSRRSDDNVLETVGNIMEFALSLPDPDGYLSDCRDDAARFAELDGMIAARRAELLHRRDELRARIAENDFSLLADVVEEIGDYIDGRIDGVTSTRFNKKYGAVCAEINDDFKALKTDCAAFREFVAECEEAKTTDSAPYARALLSVARSASEIYSRRKRELGRIDYSDLEHGALRVLASDCADEIARNVRYVFIDEYQDVNGLQSEISDALSRLGARMFLIGDVKQSIYGFRRCDPKYFGEKIAAAERGENGYTHIALSDNYRSSPEVVDFVNNVFDGLMTKDFGGADYAAEKLVYGGSARHGSAAFVEIAREYDDNGEGGERAAERANDRAYAALTDGDLPVYSVKAAAAAVACDIEADYIAAAVLDWLDKERERAEREGGEPPSFGNVAVLLRYAGNRFCKNLFAAFDRCRIKYGFDRGTSVRDYPEAAALLDILRAVDNRFDDVALYTALRSPMGGFSDAELYEIAEEGERAARLRKVSPFRAGEHKPYMFWQKAEAYDGRHSAKLERFEALRERFSRYSRSHDCADTLGFITSQIDYFQHVYENGGSAQAVEALIAFAESKKQSVHAFLADNADFELKFAGSGDAVTVTTVHSSKGLEYDFVIVADCAHKFRTDDTFDKVIVTDGGVAVSVPDRAGRRFIKSAPWLAESIKAKVKLREEELRLLYVALTRAKNSLVVCGKRKRKNDAPVDRASRARNAQNELDFMLGIPSAEPIPAAALPEPEVITSTELNAALTEAVKARCEFEYVDPSLPIKTCVTAIAEGDGEGDDYMLAAPVLTDDDEGELIKPDARRRVKGDAEINRLRGTAYHAAMEKIDFASPDLSVLDGVENAGLVDGRQILAAAAAMRELTANSAYVFREKYFISDVPCKDVYGVASGESVLVQGVIDLLAVDGAGNAVIVDYKTTAPEKLVCDAYRTQLKLYAAAVERNTPYKVTARYLYSFALGKLVPL